MTQIDYLAIGPELALTIGVVVLLLTEVTLKPRPLVWQLTSGAALIASFLLGVAQWVESTDSETINFSGMVAFDRFAAIGSLAVTLVATAAVILAWPLVVRQGRKGAELVALILLSSVGIMLMAAAANYIMLFLALEVASIALYVIAGFSRSDAASNEAAVKYFLLGAFASAVFLYGIALVYAATGSLSIYGSGGFLRENVLFDSGVLLAAIGLLIVGLGFKVSAAPFHMWAPDVYQGASSGVVGFMTAAAKIGGFAALARVLVVGLGPYVSDWAPAVAGLAAVSITVGTVLAIAQTDIKRMLAYSSVAHAGFILVGLTAGADGIPGVWFYVLTYAFQVLGAFGVVAVVGGPAGSRSALSEYGGLGQASPFLAGILGLMMLAMGGIPLTTGFAGKVSVFLPAVDAGYTWLVVLALVAAVAGLFFYLRVIVLMYMQAPAVAEAPGAARAGPEAELTEGSRFILTAMAAVTLAFGIVPGPLLEVVENALPL